MTYSELQALVAADIRLSGSKLTEATQALVGKIDSGGGLSSEQITLDHDKILALPTAYIDVIPAQADTLLIPVFTVIDFLFAAGAYDNIDPTNYMGLAYGEFDSGASSLVKFPIAGSNATAILTISLFNDPDLGESIVSTKTTSTALYGAPVKVYAINGALGDFTAGHADNTMRITTYYQSLQQPS